MKILAIAEARAGSLRRVSDEVVSQARRLADQVGGSVDVVVLGSPGTSQAASELVNFGADRILVGESDTFNEYDPDAHLAVLTEVVRGDEYLAVLLPATAMGRDYAPRLAAQLDIPLATDATALDIEDGKLIITRPLYAGKVFARLTIDAPISLVSIRPNAFGTEEKAGAGTVEPLDLTAVTIEPARVRVREFIPAAGERPDLGEATVIISGGRGLQGPENWALLEGLCDAIGPHCALGASRAVVDAGWRPHGEQVGQTGRTVAPQLYFAIGISGAIQHLAGMRTARTIVAINKDPDAPIFRIADYGVVGDAFEIVPRLAEEIRKLRAE